MVCISDSDSKLYNDLILCFLAIEEAPIYLSHHRLHLMGNVVFKYFLHGGGINSL